MSNIITISGVLSSDVANNGTVAVSLPTSQSGQTLANFQANFPVNAGDLINSQINSKLSLGSGANGIGGSDSLTSPQQFSYALTNASTITITNKSGSTWKAGTGFRLGLEMQGNRYYQDNDPAYGRKLMKMVEAKTFYINLGMPAAAAATVVAAAQAVASAANLSLNGTGVVGSVAYLDVPRNLQAVSTNAGDTTQVLTVYGLDYLGQAMRENITLNGTTVVTGVKAFASVSRVAVSAACTGNVSVGSSTKLGLPVFIAAAPYVIKEIQDSAVAAAGTFTYGLQTSGGSTATTSDVRGLYLPNTVPDGAKTYQLIVSLPDPGNIGCPQYNG